MKKEYLNFRNINYSLKQTHILSNFSFILYENESLGFLIYDAAEKDAIIQILGGNIRSYNGYIFSNGKQIDEQNTALSTYIIQEPFRLMPYQTVMENLFLSGNTKQMHPHFINWKRLKKQTQGLLDSFHIDFIQPEDLIITLNYYQCFVLEILKAVLLKKQVIVFDDLLTHFPLNDISKFKKVLCEIKKQHISIIYCSCSYHEIFSSFDRLAFVREGLVTSILNHDYITKSSIFPLTINCRSIPFPHTASYSSTPCRHTIPLLELHQFRNHSFIENSAFSFSFNIDYAQVVGILELEGNSSKSFFNAVKNHNKFYGDIILHGKTIPHRKQLSIFYKNISVVPDCRIAHILFPLMSTKENLTINFPYQNNIFHKRLLRYQNYMINKVCKKMNFDDLLCDIQANTSLVSYNPLQQFQLAVVRAVLSKSYLIIMQNPDRYFGDYNISKYYQIIHQLQSMGISILIFSNNSDSLYPVCNKILYLSDGKIYKNPEKDL